MKVLPFATFAFAAASAAASVSADFVAVPPDMSDAAYRQLVTGALITEDSPRRPTASDIVEIAWRVYRAE